MLGRPCLQNAHFTLLLGQRPKREGSLCTPDHVENAMVPTFSGMAAECMDVPLGLYEINMFFYGQKMVFFFARSFASSMFSSLTTLFALMGFQQIRDAMQMSSRRLSRRILWPSLLRNLNSPKQQIPHLKRRGSGLMNLNFDSSICLWLSKVLFFGMKCSVFGRSFSGMII